MSVEQSRVAGDPSDDPPAGKGASAGEPAGPAPGGKAPARKEPVLDEATREATRTGSEPPLVAGVAKPVAPSRPLVPRPATPRPAAPGVEPAAPAPRARRRATPPATTDGPPTKPTATPAGTDGPPTKTAGPPAGADTTPTKSAAPPTKSAGPRAKPATKTTKPTTETGKPATKTTKPAAKTGKPAAKTTKTDGPPPASDAAPAEPASRPAEAAAAAPAEAAATSAKAATATAVADKPPAEPPDPFAKFAPATPKPPSRLRHATVTAGRLVIHEWVLAVTGGLVLAALMTWPTLRYPRHTIPGDIWDPTLQAWQMAWSGHILRTGTGQLWHGNAFFPERFSFAFSDTLLGYAPAGLFGDGQAAALLRYNIMYVLLHALAFVGAYALVRQLGSGRTGAAVAGVAFAYAPWRLAQAGHMHVLSSGGIALALAMLARGHGWSLRHGYRPERRRPGWALAGWLVAAWQLSIGFAIGLPFAYLLGLILVVSVVMWFVRRTWFWGVKRPFGKRLVTVDLFGGWFFAAVGAYLSLPYFEVLKQHPDARRPVEEVRLYSPRISSYFIAPEHSRIWGGAHAPAREGMSQPAETTLLPGFALYGLALAGLFFSIWTLTQRLLLLAGVVATVVLGMGTKFFGGAATYLLLYQYLPGWDALRTPGRLVLWTTLLLGILAAGAVCALVRRAREMRQERSPDGPGFWLRLATLLPIVLVLVEGLNTTPHPVVPVAPQAMKVAQAPLLVLPSNAYVDNNVMLWSTAGFPRTVNGNSGLTPQRLVEARETTKNFPDQPSIAYLQKMGVRTVVMLRKVPGGGPPPPGIDTPVESLGIERQDLGDSVLFRIPISPS